MIASAILAAALAYGVPPWLLSSVAWVESRHNPAAVHHNLHPETGELLSTDRGLFQINDKAHPYAPAWDVYGSAHYAACFLAELRRETGSWRQAVVAYNCGLGRWKAGPPARSIKYAELVMSRAPRVRQNRVASRHARISM